MTDEVIVETDITTEEMIRIRGRAVARDHIIVRIINIMIGSIIANMREAGVAHLGALIIVVVALAMTEEEITEKEVEVTMALGGGLLLRNIKKKDTELMSEVADHPIRKNKA